MDHDDTPKRGFTLIELLVVIAVIALLSSVVIGSVNSARNKALLSRTKSDLKSMATALELYYDDQGDYPDDAGRDMLPDGLDAYIVSQEGDPWPSGPYPQSVYDWENWDDPDNPGERIYQISLRFCPAGGPLSACSFPNESWASGFDVNSALYYCVSGACRSHVDEPLSYPGYCINC